jgi:hypothetical protein
VRIKGLCKPVALSLKRVTAHFAMPHRFSVTMEVSEAREADPLHRWHRVLPVE